MTKRKGSRIVIIMKRSLIDVPGCRGVYLGMLLAGAPISYNYSKFNGPGCRLCSNQDS